MTTGQPLICRRCAFPNVPGDVFCGSCGAFLEWEGEPVAGSPSAGGATLGVAQPTGGAADPGAPPERDQDVPTPGPATPVVDASPDAGLLRCPACGIANATTRTFCQSCGTRLLEAPRVAGVSREQVVAAVNQPARPTAVVPGPVTAARDAPPASSSGRALRWVAVLVVLGLLVGVGAVGASLVFREAGPGSAATAGTPIEGGVASGPPGGASGDVPSAGTPPETPASGEPGEPTATPEPEALALTDPKASSVVGDLPKFGPDKAIDGDPKTSWQEGASQEKGQWIEVAFAPSTVTSIVLTNGYNASKALYRGNRRLKEVRIAVDGGKPTKVRLDDTAKPQVVDVPDATGATSVRITILSTYAATKTSVAGTPFDDAALAEIAVIGIPTP